MAAGKSINFIRYCIRDTEWIIDPSASAAAQRALAVGDWTVLEDVVDKAVEITNRQLTSALFGKFKIGAHIVALKQYLLLGQGDFVQYLMDVVG